jgi:hypothetical protein
MTKKLFLMIVFCLTQLFVIAQEWSIHYVGEHQNGRIHFKDGTIDKSGVTFLAGLEGPNIDSTEALFMRIDPEGNHSEYKYTRAGFRSRATCIIELPNNHLFATGNLYGETDDYLMIWILDKQLNLLEERQYEKEIEGNSYGASKAILDNHGHVIVSSYVLQSNAYQGTDYRGVFYKCDYQGDTISHRYLIEDYPDPVYFLFDFRLRQMWYNETEALLCLAPGYGNVLSFITFDSAFNYIDEHQIWQDSIDKSDHTLNRDCFTDHWYNENEALFFSSRGDADHNKLRVSRVNTHGEILDFIRLNERTDTIDDAAQLRCMATANDSTFYFSFHYHIWSKYPGIACVYLLNDKMEIIGRHVDDDHNCYRSCLILPTSDGGCITINDSCNYSSISTITHPIINKLNRTDFETVTWSTSDIHPAPSSHNAYPNPCDGTLHIPLPSSNSNNNRCQVFDNHGRIIIDCKIQSWGYILDLDVSRLKKGIYHYRIYSPEEVLRTGTFIKG